MHSWLLQLLIIIIGYVCTDVCVWMLMLIYMGMGEHINEYNI